MGNLGERVRSMRKMRALTQVQLCARSGLTQGSLSAIERGDTRSLRADTLLALSKALAVNPEWLRTGRDTPVKPEALSVEESELLALYRDLPARAQDELLRMGRALHALTVPDVSPVAPFRAEKVAR